MEKSEPKYPIGIQSFETIRSGGYVYIINIDGETSKITIK